MNEITDVKPVSKKKSAELLYEENRRLREERARLLARIGELDIAVRHMANPANYKEGTPWLVVDGVVYHPCAFSTAALNGEPLRGTGVVEVIDGP